MKHTKVLIPLFAVVFLLLLGGIQFLAYQSNVRDADNAVTACERGNVIRNYLAFDNGERITRIETRLTSEVDPPAEDEVAELQSELTRRLEQRQVLVPFECESLR